MSVIVNLLSKFDDSGIKKAKGSFGGLKKAIGAIGIGIGISQITNLLMESAKAASADQKSTQLLNTQLIRNAGATKAQIKQSDKFIEKLSLQTGIMDDDLRPSMGKFVRVTKDVNKAQQLLTLSLDASATTGKPLEKVSTAISQAFVGNRKQLEKLFPALKTSKDLFGDLEKIVGGAAIQQADPFSKFNNSMDILKEKLGAAVLPLIEDFVAEITKPGGLVDQVGKFLEDLSDPKTDAGKMFVDIKNAVKDAFGYVKDFFALFGGGDAMEGFKNVATTLIQALPALLALKGILMLASAGKAISNLAQAVGLIQAKSATSAIPAAGAGVVSVAVMSIAAIALTQLATQIAVGMADASVKQQLKEKGLQATTASAVFGARGEVMAIPTTGNIHDMFGFYESAGLKPPTGKPATTININVQSADPKAVVDAVVKYGKANGGLPFAGFSSKGR